MHVTTIESLAASPVTALLLTVTAAAEGAADTTTSTAEETRARTGLLARRLSMGGIVHDTTRPRIGDTTLV